MKHERMHAIRGTGRIDAGLAGVGSIDLDCESGVSFLATIAKGVS
ncbi:MAG: hypothetical protein ABSA12_02490 [Verrucomicrobiia bacterium]